MDERVAGPQAEGIASRARLKIYFGAAPGVGLTSAMLREARESQRRGLDVVAGFVEPRGREEVATLLESFEAFPRRTLRYQGEPVEILDLEGILKRRPGLVLVEDLSFANPRGARHPYRWQDVLELLDEGIDVAATLDLIHLESLRDAVARITGLKVPVTVPDSVVARASELQLVDLPVEELLERHRSGKAALPPAFAYATERFFRKGNLLALREMALRKTAEKVDAQLAKYQQEKDIKDSWHVGERLLVAIGPRSASAELIRATARLASALDAPWIAVYVESTRRWARSPKSREGLDINMRLAEQLGAEIVTIEQAGLRPSDDLLAFARSRHVTKIVIGKPSHTRWLDFVTGSVLDDLARKGGDIDVFIIAGEKGKGTRPSFKFSKAPLVALPMFTAVVAVAVLTAGLLAAHSYAGSVSAYAAFLALVALVAGAYGRYPGITAGLASAFAYHWIWMHQPGGFQPHPVVGWLLIALLGVMGLYVGELTERLRRQARFSMEREQRTQALFRFGLDLSQSGASVQLTEVAVRHLAEIFGLEARVLLPGPAGLLRLEQGAGPTGLESEAAAWAFDHSQPSGRSSENFSDCEGYYLPLLGSTGPVGVLALRGVMTSKRFGPPQRQLLEAFARQAALALERSLLAEQSAEAMNRIAEEELRTSLLASLAQSLEGPLHNLSDLAWDLRTTLKDRHGKEQVEAVHHEAIRLHRLVASLIRLTHLERGSMQVRKEWTTLGALLAGARAKLGDVLETHTLNVQLPDSQIPVDRELMEEVLVHLLDNALRYSPKGSPVELKGWTVGETVTFAVADRGPGIPDGEEEHIFEKLRKGTRISSRPGGGLGLAICHGIVDAHGGRIQAHSRPQGGAQFLVTLPIEGRPPTHVRPPAESEE
jgi:two-component system sensor histidine kinase KdpD